MEKKDLSYSIEVPEEMALAIKECGAHHGSIKNARILVVPEGCVISQDNIQQLVDQGVCQVMAYSDYIEAINQKKATMQEKIYELEHVMNRVPNTSAAKKLAAETLDHNNSALGAIPQDLRNRINAEYIRLRSKHPDWKMNRLLKNAGKKFNVKFTFE